MTILSAVILWMARHTDVAKKISEFLQVFLVNMPKMLHT